MNHKLPFVAILVFVGMTANSHAFVISQGKAGAPQDLNTPQKFRPNEIIIKFKEKPIQVKSTGMQDIPTINRIGAKHRLRNIRKLGSQGTGMPVRNQVARGESFLEKVYLITIEDDNEFQQTLNSFKNDPDVEYAQPNYIYSALLVPNDPHYVEQYALPRVFAEPAWDITEGNSTTIIAIVDSGVDGNHPDLGDNMWTNLRELPGDGIDNDGNGFVDDVKGWDFVNNDNDPADEHGHGTHVAGIAGARGNNGIGVAGMCWNCRVMPIRVLDKNGEGTVAGITGGIVYAMQNGANVVNLSLGGIYYSELMNDAIQEVSSAGVLIVAAAGNRDSSLKFYPAAYANVLSVASTDQTDEKSYFSSYGTWVSASAPGLSILSTFPTYPVTYPGRDYATLNGTSMACPLVAGLAGLLISRYPGETVEKIKDRILLASDDISEKNPKYVGLLGNGRINALNSLGNITIPSYSLTGRIVNTNNSPVSGVTIFLSGRVQKTATSDISGNYVFTMLSRGNYSIRPESNVYDFTPFSNSIPSLSSNQTIGDFVASPLQLFSISGALKNADGQDSFGTLRLFDDENKIIATKVTDFEGRYEFASLRKSPYRVEVVGTGEVFGLNERDYPLLMSNQTDQDYISIMSIRQERIDWLWAAQSSIALERNGSAVAAYVAGNHLYFSRRNSFNNWSIEKVADAAYEGKSVLQIDSENKPHIVYQEKMKLLLSNHLDADWKENMIREANVTDFDFKMDLADVPVIVYISRDVSTYRLWRAKWDGSQWIDELIYDNPESLISTQIDSLNRIHVFLKNFEGHIVHSTWDGEKWTNVEIQLPLKVEDVSIAIDRFGVLHFVGWRWMDRVVLVYGRMEGSKFVWELVDGNNSVGQFCQLKVDAMGTPSIVYFDNTNQAFKYARKSSNGWIYGHIISRKESSFNSAQTASIVLDGGGMPHISYSDQQLNYARGIISNTNFHLDVDNGIGGGDYPSGLKVGVSAAPSLPGRIFSKWIGPAVFENPRSPATVLTMPSSNLTVKAEYIAAPNRGELQFFAATLSASENANLVVVAVKRFNGSDGSVGVRYETKDGTAQAGVDYEAIPEPNASPSPSPTPVYLNFANGETEKTITLKLIDNNIYTGDRSFQLILKDPTNGAILGTPSVANITILEDDPVPALPNVTVVPEFFDPTKGESTTIKLKVDFTQRLKVEVLNGAEESVKVLFNRSMAAREELYSLIWDGKDTQGAVVPFGIYKIQVSNPSLPDLIQPKSVSVEVKQNVPTITSFTLDPTTLDYQTSPTATPLILARYTLAIGAEVQLVVLNSLGLQVRTLNLVAQTAGGHTVTWDLKNEANEYVPNGDYTVQLIAGNSTQNRTAYITGHAPNVAPTLGVSPQEFQYGRDQNVRIDYTMEYPTDIRIDVMKIEGDQTQIIRSWTPEYKGVGSAQYLDWNMKASNGLVISAGAYLIVLKTKYHTIPRQLTVSGIPMGEASPPGTTDSFAKFTNKTAGPMTVKLDSTISQPYEIRIYTMRGQEVRTITGTAEASAAYEVPWDGRNDKGELVVPDVYLLKLKMAGKTETKKVVIVR